MSKIIEISQSGSRGTSRERGFWGRLESHIAGTKEVIV
jgi:hypothetical protein